MDRIEKLRSFLEEQPDDPFLKHALALELIKTGDDITARRLFEELLQLHPGYIGSYYHLAKLFERIGNRQKALEWYQKGIQAAKDAGDKHALSELSMAYEDFTDSE